MTAGSTSPPYVKICGLTNLADALAAADAGADYLGFIFYAGSRRAVSVATVQMLTPALRARVDCPVLVGVFVNASAESIAHTLAVCQLDLAQLSGDEPPFLVGDPQSPIYGRAYKALRPASFLEAEADAEWYTAPATAHPWLPDLLLDSYQPGQYGGAGLTGDWEIAARLARQVPRLMLAGGLTPANVAAAVAQVQPFAVDVAGGVEAAPGSKDPAAVQRFVAAAKGRQV